MAQEVPLVMKREFPEGTWVASLLFETSFTLESFPQTARPKAAPPLRCGDVALHRKACRWTRSTGPSWIPKLVPQLHSRSKGARGIARAI